MDTLPQKVARVWREEHSLTRAGVILILICSLAQVFLEPAFKKAVVDPARPTAAEVDHGLGIFMALMSAMTLQIVALVFIGTGTCIKIRQRKRVRRTPWWRDR